MHHIWKEKELLILLEDTSHFNDISSFNEIIIISCAERHTHIYERKT